MMKQKLTDRQKMVLAQIFKDENLECLIGKIENESLIFSEIEKACDLISGEFHMKGIDANFEANEYGVEVEALLDVVNRPRLR
jgi:hypothetical protein